MRYFVYNIVYESCSDTGVGILAVDDATANEILAKMDPQTGFVDQSDCSFDFDDIMAEAPDVAMPFQGLIEACISLYWG